MAATGSAQSPSEGNSPNSTTVRVELHELKELLPLVVKHFEQQPDEGIWKHIKDKTPILAPVGGVMVSLAAVFISFLTYQPP